jgi:hypothetical protein
MFQGSVSGAHQAKCGGVHSVRLNCSSLLSGSGNRLPKSEAKRLCISSSSRNGSHAGETLNGFHFSRVFILTFFGRRSDYDCVSAPNLAPAKSPRSAPNVQNRAANILFRDQHVSSSHFKPNPTSAFFGLDLDLKRVGGRRSVTIFGLSVRHTEPPGTSFAL